MSHSSKFLVAVALCAVTATAGCGSDDPKDGKAGTTTPTTAVETATPMPPSPAEASGASQTEKWAQKTCRTLASAMKSVQPPSVQGTSPAETKKSLESFFTSLADQLGGQAKVLKEIGPPPGPNARREYDRAIDKLASIQSRVEGLSSRVAKSEVTSAKDVETLTADLGKSLQVMATYDGPIPQLMKTRSLRDALAAEPACAAVSVAPQTTS